MEKIYKLIGKKTPMGKSSSVYDLVHQINLSKHTAQNNDWNIAYNTPFFYVTDKDNHTDTVFRANTANAGFFNYDCTCDYFIENKSGTCPHIEAVKLIPSYSMSDINNELRKLNNYQYIHSYYEQIVTVGEPKYKTKSFMKYNSLFKDNNSDFLDFDVDINIFKQYGITLKNYQKYSIEKMLKFKKTILCLKMGLGKTVCALVAQSFIKNDRILIICPNSLKYQWQKEINRFDLGSSIVLDKSEDLSKIYDQKFIILSYQLMNNNIEFFEKNSYDILIVDEVQKIKNNETITWKNIVRLRSEYTFTLSGTPLENHVNDLISIINFLNPNEFNPLWKFYYQYCDYTKAKVLGLKSNMIEAFKNRIAKYIINPKIDDSELKLPELVEYTKICEIDQDSKACHDKYFDMAVPLLSKAFTKPLTLPEKNALNGYLTMARLASTDARLVSKTERTSNRFTEIENLIEEITKDNKIVIFSEWIKATDLLIDFLEKNNIGYVYFNSTINSKKKQMNLNQFIKDDSIKVFLSTDSGGLGVDGLQLACHHLIHIERVWNPAKIKQRNGRLVRTLQSKDKVYSYYFTCKTEVEIMVEESNLRKNTLIENVFF